MFRGRLHDDRGLVPRPWPILLSRKAFTKAVEIVDRLNETEELSRNEFIEVLIRLYAHTITWPVINRVREDRKLERKRT